MFNLKRIASVTSKYIWQSNSKSFSLYSTVFHLLKVSMSKIKIGTHNGKFHCDEVLACFMLKLLPEYKDATIVRTRDMSILNTCDIVVDVGGKYDPSTHRYDHHMRDFKESISTLIKKPEYDSTIKLSSAGLIYCHFGHKIIKHLVPELNEDDVEIIFKKVYDTFMKEIDGIDNGIPMFDSEPLYRITTDISSRVSRLNCQWNATYCNEEEQFHKAITMVGEEFTSVVEYFSCTWLPARTYVKESIEKRFEVDPSGEIMELITVVPWTEHFFNIEKELNISPLIKFVIFKDNTYRVQCIPEHIGSFISRIFLPEEWAGLRDENLSNVAGIKDCVFVHATRFIGGNKTREGALAMARKALKIGRTPEK